MPRPDRLETREPTKMMSTRDSWRWGKVTWIQKKAAGVALVECFRRSSLLSPYRIAPSTSSYAATTMASVLARLLVLTTLVPQTILCNGTTLKTSLLSKFQGPDTT